jgi:hypothetical protein
MRFQRNITLLLDEWRLVVVKLNDSAEIGVDAWSSPMPRWIQRRRCPSGSTALGEHLREEHLASMASCHEHPLQHPWQAAM